MPPRNASRPAQPPPAAPASSPRWLHLAMLSLVALLLFTRFTPDVHDSDAWWHLETGEYLVHQRSLPVPDPFAWTTYLGTPAYPEEGQVRYFNLTHEWLAQIVFYLAYAAGGFPGLILFRAVLLAGACGVVGWIAYRRTGGFYRSLLAVVLAASIAQRYTSDRPFLITFLFLAITIALVDARRYLWALPLLFVAWANMHGGYFLGWAALGAYAGDAFLRRQPWAEQRQLWMAGAVSVAACALNPNGLLAITMPLTYNKSALQRGLWEWQHTALWPLEMFGVVLFATVAALLWARSRVRVSDWLLFAAFAAAAIWAVRNVMLVGIIGPVIIASHWPWKRAIPRIAEFAVGALLIAGIAAGFSSGRAFQLRAGEWAYPKGAADFILAHRLSGRMFNTYEHGGYLMWRLWPQQRVFTDGRALNEKVFLDYRRMAANADDTGGTSAEELLAQYGIEIIVMNGFEPNSGATYLLPAALSDPAQTEWKLVYQDAQAVVFMRNPPPGVQPLDSRLALSSVEAQCNTRLEHDPEHPGCAAALSGLFARIGDGARSSQWRARALQYVR